MKSIDQQNLPHYEVEELYFTEEQFKEMFDPDNESFNELIEDIYG